MDLHQTEYKGLNIYYYNSVEFETLFEEIFKKDVYHFSTSKRQPRIIDCGSHIGLSILYFKMIYADASIIAFEPDTRSYDLLVKNVEVNQLQDVQIYNYAVSNIDGDQLFFHESEVGWDSCGNTLNSKWGDRFGFGKKTVNSVLLSKYLKEEIDFLKMDIEGEEVKVIKEIEDHLHLINELAVEFHIYDNESKNEMNLAFDILNEYFREVKQETYSLVSIMPDRYLGWVNQYDPYVVKIRGKND